MHIIVNAENTNAGNNDSYCTNINSYQHLKAKNPITPIINNQNILCIVFMIDWVRLIKTPHTLHHTFSYKRIYVSNPCMRR